MGGNYIVINGNHIAIDGNHIAIKWQLHCNQWYFSGMKKECEWNKYSFKKLNDYYNNWIENYKEGPLLIIDSDKNKFAENEEHLGQVISKIDSTLFGLF